MTVLCPGAGIIYAIVSASQQSSSAQLSALSHGPGDNSECEHEHAAGMRRTNAGPCENYTTLTEGWRRIGQASPRTAGLHCDTGLQVTSQGCPPLQCSQTVQEGWYRLEGEAGTQLADIRDPQRWESCATSRVAWLRGNLHYLSCHLKSCHVMS